ARGIPGNLRAGIRDLAVADVARGGAGGALHHRLSGSAGVAAAVPPAGGVDERRRIADALALSACADGAANDRGEDRHRRLRRALSDAARLADNKWETVFGDLIPRVQRAIAARLALPDATTIAFAPNTHDFVRRLLSALPAAMTPRILSSDSEFHSFTRQIARLE